MTTQDVHTKINWLNSHEVKHILESNGFAVDPTESEGDLREALRENIMDNTIPEHILG